MDCPEENAIVDFVRGELSAAAAQGIEEHLDGCPACAQVVAEVAKLEGPSLASADVPTLDSLPTDSPRAAKLKLPPPLRQGDKLGRYVVLDRVGAGGMGVVYAAYDPELDRKVAIKLLLVSAGGSLPKELQEQRTRLMREAQAMAKLTHPNVITVHDVGELQGQVFVAMEFVGGPTLKQWMAAGPHPYAQVLEVFLAAGRGLAAAHAAGLVHRDFKPDNVLLSHDPSQANGSPVRVIVTDFGLARPAAGKTDNFTAVGVVQRSPVLSAQLTQTGELVGTPAYMAPEQLHGERSDALGDQFSFCVALYEGLWGERPFAGDRLGELMGNVSSGNIRPLNREASVPRWVRRAIVQGLATAPKERHRDMEALLAALQRDPTRRWRVWAAAALPVGLLGVGLWAWQRGEPSEGGYCHEMQQQLAALWTPARASAIEQAFVGSDKPFARDAWNGTRQSIEEYVHTWTDRQRSACTAQVEGTQPQSVLALRMRCLERHRDHLAEVLDILDDARAQTIERAVDVVGTLPDPRDCDEVERISQRLAGIDAEDASTQRAELDRLLARARALQAGGDFDRAKEVALEALALARSVEDRFMQAETLTVLGDVEDLLGQRDVAQQHYRGALAAAIEVDHPREIVRASIGMLWVAGDEGQPLAQARWFQELGAAALRRSGPDPELHARLQTATGFALLEHGDLQGAESALRHALKIREDAFGPGHPSRGSALATLGRVLAQRGRLDDATQVFEQALAAVREEYGPHHPSVAAALDNLGACNGEAGRHAEAAKLHRQALQVREAAMGPDHLRNAHSHYNLSLALEELGELEPALEHVERAVEIYEGNPAPAIDEGNALDHMGTLHVLTGKPHLAVEVLTRAYELFEAHLGPEHRRTARTQLHLARALTDSGAHTEAMQMAGEAIRHLERALGPDDRRVVRARVEHAGILADAGATASNIEAALAPVLERDDVDPELLALARDVLSGGPRAPARPRPAARESDPAQPMP